VLQPRQSIFFMPGTIHFVFRTRDSPTLSIGGHVLRWSGLQRWIETVLDQIKYPDSTNEEDDGSVLSLVHTVDKLVSLRVEDEEYGWLGGEDVLEGFRKKIKVCAPSDGIVDSY